VNTISSRICKLPPNTAVCIYTTTGALRAAVVVYIESVVLWGSLHIHQEMVYTSHVLIFSRPKTWGGVYIYTVYIYYIYTVSPYIRPVIYCVPIIYTVSPLYIYIYIYIYIFGVPILKTRHVLMFLPRGFQNMHGVKMRA